MKKASDTTSEENTEKGLIAPFKGKKNKPGVPAVINPSAVKFYQLTEPTAKPGAEDEEMEALSLPPLIKQTDLPIGARIDAILDDIKPSMKKSIKGRIMHLIKFDEPNKGTRFAFPVTGVIGNALGKDDAAQDEHIGKRIVIVKTDEKVMQGKKGGIYSVAVSKEKLEGY